MLPIDLKLKQKILVLLQDDTLTSRQIALQCHVSHTTVQELHRKHHPNHNLSVGGRPQKLSSQNKHYVIRAVTSGKFKTALAAQNDLKTNLNIKVDESTI
jgi:transposase